MGCDMSLPDRVPTYADLPVVDDAPPKSAWGVFGRDDQLGTLNFLTPERRLAAVRNVRRGEVFNLDLPMHLPRPPMIAARPAYRRTNLKFPMNRGRDDVMDNFYLQCSSQWDSLKHIRHPEFGFYNWTSDDVADSEEDGRLGIDNFSRSGIVGRGVLLDVARYLESRGQPIQPYERREIPVSLLEEVAGAQGVSLQPGDVLLFRTAVGALIFHEAEHPESAVRPLPGGPGYSWTTAHWRGSGTTRSPRLSLTIWRWSCFHRRPGTRACIGTASRYSAWCSASCLTWSRWRRTAWWTVFTSSCSAQSRCIFEQAWDRPRTRSQ